MIGPASPDYRRRDAGFSLVELMVAATILGLAVSGALTLIGTGRAIDAEEVLRRQAILYATSALENPALNYTNTPLPAGPVLPAAPALSLKIHGAPDVAAGMAVVVANATKEMENADGGTIFIPYQTVTATVTWTGPTGAPQSVSIQKYVADADDDT